MPRALLWNKWVYELWFKYSLAALEEGMPIPVEFGPIDQFEDFESWWRHEQYGFELFCEVYEEPAEIVKEVAEDDLESIYIKINRRSDKDVIRRAVKRILDKEHILIEEYSSTARFQPSQKSMRNINRDQLTDYLKVFELSRTMDDKQVALKMGFYKKSGGGIFSLKDFMRPIRPDEYNKEFEEVVIEDARKQWKNFERVQIRKVQRYKSGCRKLLRRVSTGVFP